MNYIMSLKRSFEQIRINDDINLNFKKKVKKNDDLKISNSHKSNKSIKYPDSICENTKTAKIIDDFNENIMQHVFL